MNAILQLNDIYGGYSREPVVKGISLAIEHGEFTGIIGPNGAGKSTLLRLMSRSLNPRKGEILFENKNTRHIPARQLYKKIAFVSQYPAMYFSFSVWEIVLMGRIPHLSRLAAETKKDFAAAQEALSLTGCLTLKDKAIDELSAGERQLVFISKAFAQEPVLLFLDEPTSHLDIGHQVQIMDLLKRLNRGKKLTIVVVLHDLNLAAEYCSRIVLIDKGGVFADGKAENVLTYQNIEAVYKTIVVVNKNPVSGNPYITLVSGDKLCPPN